MKRAKKAKPAWIPASKLKGMSSPRPRAKKAMAPRSLAAFRTPSDIKAYVRASARRRVGDHAFICTGGRLLIGTSNEDGEWYYFDCRISKEDGGYEAKK
jgi:hypothetical protein